MTEITDDIRAAIEDAVRPVADRLEEVVGALPETVREIVATLDVAETAAAGDRRSLKNEADMHVLRTRIDEHDAILENQREFMEHIVAQLAKSRQAQDGMVRDMTAIKAHMDALDESLRHDMTNIKSALEPLRWIDKRQGERLDELAERMGVTSDATVQVLNDLADLRQRFAERINPLWGYIKGDSTRAGLPDQIQAIQTNVTALEIRAREEDERRRRIRAVLESRAGAAIIGGMGSAVVWLFGNFDLDGFGQEIYEIIVQALGG
jgi:chromosome segregation ATPase